MMSSNCKVVGAIRDGGVEPPPGGWNANAVYEVIYVENKDEKIVQNDMKDVIKSKVKEVLEKDQEKYNAIVVWAGGQIEEMDFLDSPGLLEFVRDEPELTGAALRGCLGTMKRVEKDKGQQSDFRAGVAAATIYLSEVGPHSAF